MARITYIPNRVIDTNGIADGASINVYQSGTSTPVSLFSDSGLTVPVLNPYVVPAGAAVPTLYTSYSGDLRLRVVQSDGSVSQEEDPYERLVTQVELGTGGSNPGAALVVADDGENLQLKLARFPVYPETYGAVGDGVADDAAAINAADAAALLQGRTVTFRKVYRVASQLLMSTDWRFEGGEIIRDWPGTHTTGDKDESATIKGRGNDALIEFYVADKYTPTGVLNGLSLTGRGSIHMSETVRTYYDDNDEYHATTLYMLCDNFQLGGGIRLGLGGRDWCTFLYGDNMRVNDLTIFCESEEGAHLFEDGLHIVAGRNGIITACNLESGDDTIALANTWNLPISNWEISDCVVFSHCAQGLKVAGQRAGANIGGGVTPWGPVTEWLEDIRFTNIRWAAPAGRPSRNGYAAFDAAGISGGLDGLVRNVKLVGGDFSLGENNGVPAEHTSDGALPGFRMSGPIEGCVMEGRVRNCGAGAGIMYSSTLGGAPENCGFVLDSPDAPNWTDVTRRAVELIDTTGCWVDGDIRAGNASGGTKRTVLLLTNAVGTYSNWIVGRDIPSALPMVEVGGTTDAYTVLDRVEAWSESGATGNSVVESAAVIYRLKNIITDLPFVVTNPTTPSLFVGNMSLGFNLTTTIGSGAIFYTGGDLVGIHPEGGVNDSMATISNGIDGAEIEIYNADPNPATNFIDINNTGNIAIPATLRLNTNTQRIRLRYVAGVDRWVRIGKVVNTGRFTGTTNASGDLTISHRLGSTPTVAWANPAAATFQVASRQTEGPSTFTVRIFDAAGAAIASTSVTVDWYAERASV